MTGLEVERDAPGRPVAATRNASFCCPCSARRRSSGRPPAEASGCLGHCPERPATMTALSPYRSRSSRACSRRSRSYAFGSCGAFRRPVRFLDSLTGAVQRRPMTRAPEPWPRPARSGVSSAFATVLPSHHWKLGFWQYSLRHAHLALALRSSFTALQLGTFSRPAMVPFPFRDFSRFSPAPVSRVGRRPIGRLHSFEHSSSSHAPQRRTARGRPPPPSFPVHNRA